MRIDFRLAVVSLVLLAASSGWAVQTCTNVADCFDGNDCTVDACTTNVCVWTAAPACGPFVDVPLAARKIKLHIPPSAPDRNGLRMLTTEGQFTLDNLPNPVSEPASDPFKTGGSLRLFTEVGDAFDQTYPLPKEHWDYFPAFDVSSFSGYQYKDAFNEASPIGVVKIIADKTMKVKGKDAMPFTLVANPDPVQVVLMLGRYRYCFSMGGERFNFKSGQIYWSKVAPAPVACP